MSFVKLFKLSVVYIIGYAFFLSSSYASHKRNREDFNERLPLSAELSNHNHLTTNNFKRSKISNNTRLNEVESIEFNEFLFSQLKSGEILTAEQLIKRGIDKGCFSSNHDNNFLLKLAVNEFKHNNEGKYNDYTIATSYLNSQASYELIKKNKKSFNNNKLYKKKCFDNFFNSVLIYNKVYTSQDLFALCRENNLSSAQNLSIFNEAIKFYIENYNCHNQDRISIKKDENNNITYTKYSTAEVSNNFINIDYVQQYVKLPRSSNYAPLLPSISHIINPPLLLPSISHIINPPLLLPSISHIINPLQYNNFSASTFNFNKLQIQRDYKRINDDAHLIQSANSSEVLFIQSSGRENQSSSNVPFKPLQTVSQSSKDTNFELPQLGSKKPIGIHSLLN